METQIKKLGSFSFSANYIYNAHSHAEFEVNYVTAGKCVMTVCGNRMVLKKGDCILIAPHCKHNFMVPGAKPCCITQFEFLPTQAVSVAHASEICPKLSNCCEVLECMENIRAYHTQQKKTALYANLLELEVQKLFVLLELHRQAAETIRQHLEINPLHKIIAHLQANYEQSIDLTALAKAHKISPRYLRVLFTKYVGMSAIDYITMLRMEKAKDMLKNTTQSVSEVSACVGYNSVQYFSTVFKRKTGVSPKTFRTGMM